MSINDQCIKLIKKYQTSKPPGTPKRCVHYPTCSNYAIECYQKFNFFKASFLSFNRILFCTPLNKKFYDPVPLTKEEKKQRRESKKQAMNILPLLKEHIEKYPLMELDDFLILLFEEHFGGINNPNIDEKKILKREDLNTKTQRVYLENSKQSRINYYLGNDIINQMSETLPLFYSKVNLLLKLIYKKEIKINLKYSSIKQQVQDYLFNLRYLKHSQTYIDNYSDDYLIINKTDLS